MPKTEIKGTKGSVKEIRIEVEKERFEQEISASMKKVRENVQIPGFRKGKVPESIIQKRFGAYVKEEAVRDMIPKVLSEVFEEKGFNPVNEPNVEDLEIAEDGGVSFTVKIEEVPEIDISGFNGLKVTKIVPEVTDKDVENEVERYRHYHAKQEEVDRPAALGDILLVDIQKMDSSGVPIIGEKLEKRVIHLDGSSIPPEMEQQLIGVAKGDERVVRFSGKPVQGMEDTETWKVTVIQVFENRMPEWTEEFLKSLGDFENLEQLKAVTKDRLKLQADSAAERRLRMDLVEEFIKEFPFDVPASMVERVISSEIERVKKTNAQAEFDEQEYRSQMHPDAVRAVQTYLIVEAVKKQENIEVTKEELDERIETIARINDMNPKEVKRKLIKEGRLDGIRNELTEDKAYEWMTDVADIELGTVENKTESHILKP